MFYPFYRLSCFYVFIVVIRMVCGCNERRVVEAIFPNHNKQVRPVLQQNYTLDIEYELKVHSIISVDEPNEIINLLLWITLQWHDQFLSWNPDDFNGCTKVKVPANLIWLPDVYFINALDVESISPTDNNIVWVRYYSKIRQTLKYNTKLSCAMAIGDFPFDTQHCPITIGLWSHNYEEVALHLRYPVTGLAPYNGEEEYAPIMGSKSEFETVNFTGLEVVTTVGHTTYSELHYSIELKRRPAYYVYVILIPSYLLTSLCIIGIFTPSSNINERNERVTMGLTTLLSMAVILNIVADQMPKGSEGLPLLGIFVLYEIGICALAIILSVIIIFIHQRAHTRRWKPPALCLWIGRARASKTDRVSPTIVKRNPMIGCESDSLDDSINHVMEKNFKRLATILRSMCNMFHDAIENMERRIREDEEREYCELIWQSFVDALDLFLLVLLLLLNTLISYILMAKVIN